jgi:ABC-type sugar transport system ATPase subunit
MVKVTLEGVSKSFGEIKAVDRVSFQVEEGEVVTLLGPSGCGKSTTLRLIAGFLLPDEGKILFGDEDVTNLPPQDRETAMVFQNYALWPHLSVRKNVEFGLSVRKVPKEEKNYRVKEALKRVDLDKYMDRMPNKLSGGQQQRVAVARALVVNPEVLLLDEPLSNLDAKLRVETRQQIRSLVKDLNLTTIFVTHDQSEALSISDRIAVLDEGKLRQIGTPHEIWTTPTSAFVGTFIGEANTLEMQVEEIQSDHVKLSTIDASNNKVILKSIYFLGIDSVGITAKVIIRPEKCKVHTEAVDGTNILKAKVRIVMFFGGYTLVVVSLANNNSLNLHLPSQTNLRERQMVYLEIDPDNLRAFGPKNY